MESMSLAGKLQLSKLIVMHDSNDVQLDTGVQDVMTDNLKQKMESMQWHYQLVEENNVELIDQAITAAKKSNKPSFIEIKTIIGEGSKKQGTSAVHGAPIGDEIEDIKKILGWEEDNFFLSDEVKKYYDETLVKRSQEAVKNFIMSPTLKKFLDDVNYQIDISVEENLATRESSGRILKKLNSDIPQLIGGSADLSSSTKVSGGDGVFSPKNRMGRHILFGVREFAMGTIANGLALHSNFKPFVSTFFTFIDYMKPALRLSTLMKLPVIYVMTHDSVLIGEDGSTHQPVEQLALARSIPNITVIRPADEQEVIGAWQWALNSQKSPTILVLTRQNIESLSGMTAAKNISKGYYNIHQGNSKFNIVSTGSELANALKVGKDLDLSVYSMPSTELVEDYNLEWENTISIEAATTFGWRRFAKHNIGVDTFGKSAKPIDIQKDKKLDYESLLERIKQII